MNTKGIKFLAVLAVLAMAFAVFAVVSDAETDDAAIPSSPTEVSTLDDLVAKLSGSSEFNVKLTANLEDKTLSSPIVITKDGIIDFNGHTVSISAVTTPVDDSIGVYDKSQKGFSSVLINKATSFTMKDSSADANGGITVKVTSASAALMNMPGAKATIESGKYVSTNASASESRWYLIKNLGDLTINGGSFEGVHYAYEGNPSMIANGYYGNKSVPTDVVPTLAIKGGLFDGGYNTLKNDDFGVATISNGIFKNTIQAVVLNWNELTINGGSFIGASESIVNGAIPDINSGLSDKGKLAINGGTFEGKMRINTDPGCHGIGEISTTLSDGVVFEVDKALTTQGTAKIGKGVTLSVSAALTLNAGGKIINDGAIVLKKNTEATGGSLIAGNEVAKVGEKGICGEGTVTVEGVNASLQVGAGTDGKLITNKVIVNHSGVVKIKTSELTIPLVNGTGAYFTTDAAGAKITVEPITKTYESVTYYKAKITTEGEVTATSNIDSDTFVNVGDELIVKSGTLTFNHDFKVKVGAKVQVDKDATMKFSKASGVYSVDAGASIIVNGTLEIGNKTNAATFTVNAGTAATSVVGQEGILGSGTVVVNDKATLTLYNDKNGSMITAANTKVFKGGVLTGMIATSDVAVVPSAAATADDYILAVHKDPASSYWKATDGMIYTVSGNWIVNDSLAPGALLATNNSVVVESGTITLASAITVPASGSLSFGEGATGIATPATYKVTNNGTINYASPAQVYANVDNTNGHIHIAGDSGDEDIKTDSTTTDIKESDFSNVDVIVSTAAVETAVIPEGKTLVIQNASALTTVDVSKEDSVVSLVGMAGDAAGITVKAGENTLVLKGVKGTITITKGSIYIDGKIEGGVIELDEGADVKLKGSIDGTTGDVTIKMKSGASKATVTILEEDSVSIESANKLIIDKGVTLNVYGTITNKDPANGVLKINADATLNVMSGGKIVKDTEGGSIEVIGKGTVYSGASINGVIITPADWTGKDANGGTWTFDGGVLTLKNYNGSYNLAAIYDTDGLGDYKTIAATITTIKITGDNKITYKLPAEAATTIFGSDYSIGEISTIDTASLTVEVDYSKLSKTRIDGQNVIFSVEDGFKIEGVDVTIVAKGSSDKWVDFETNHGVRVTAIKGAGDISIKNAELDIDVLSSLDSRYVSAIVTADTITIKNSVVDIKSAGNGIETGLAGTDTIDVSSSTFSVNAKHIAINVDEAKVTFDTCVKVVIAGSVGIIADDVEFDSCVDAEITGTRYAIVGINDALFVFADDINLSHSIISVKGDVSTNGTVEMVKAGLSVDGMLAAENFTLTQDSVLAVKDLYVDGKGLNKSVITKGTVTVMGSASFVGDLENNDVLNNAGVMGVYNVFTNNGTFNNTGKLFVYAKEAPKPTASNNKVEVTGSDYASAEGKVKVQKIELSTEDDEVIMNADGTISVIAKVTFVTDAGEPISSDALKVGTRIFAGTMSLADLIKSDEKYYTLELTNGTATIKVTYKKLTEGYGDEIGKSYTIDVAGKITKGDVDYNLEANKTGKGVTDTIVSASLIGASGADFNSTDVSSLIVNEGELTILASETKTIGGKFVGDLTTYLSDLTVGAFVGDIYSKGTVTVTAKKLMIGDIVTDGVITINGTLEGNAVTKDSVVINGTVDGNVAVTTGTTAKTVTVGGKFVGDLYFYSKYLAKSTDKEGEESIATNVMKVNADMSTSEKTFVINLTAAKNATTSTPGEGGAFAFGTLNAPATTKAVQLTLNEGKIVVPSDVTLPERFEVIIEKDTTLEVAKNYKLNVKSAALKVSKDATRNFVITTDVSATYGTVEYIMTFDIEGGAYTIFSDVTYALTNCDEGAELTLGSAAEINANVSVKKGVSIIVDGVKLDFKTFGLDMDEGAKIILKGAGNLAFGITGDNTADADREENEFYTISGTIVYDTNAITFEDVRFNAASTVKGTAATSTAASKINATLTYNEGTATVSAGTGTGTITLANTSYFLQKDDTEKTLFTATFVVGADAVFDAVAINDAFAVVDYKKEAGDTDVKIDKYKALATIVGVEGTLNLSATTYVKGVYGGLGTITLADGKEFVLDKSAKKPTVTTADVTVPGTVAAKIVDTTDNQNGYVLNLVSALDDKTVAFKATKQKIAGETINVMTIAGNVGIGIITATDDAFVNELIIQKEAALVAEEAYIIGDSRAIGFLGAKEIYMKEEGITSDFKNLDYQVSFEEEGYTFYGYFATVDFDEVSDITINGNYELVGLTGLMPAGTKKVDLSGKDVNITIADGKALTVNVPLILGTPIDSIGAMGSSITGKVIIKASEDGVTAPLYRYIVAYSDVDLLDAEIYQDDGKTAAVYSMLLIDDLLYATIFANDGTYTPLAGAEKAQYGAGMGLALADKTLIPDIEGYIFTKWSNLNDDPNAAVGETNAYASAKAISVTVIVKFAEGVSYYLDGVEFAVYDTPTKVDYNSVFTAKINNTAKYEGTPLINGKNSFIVTEDATLTVTGVNPIPVPPEPTPEPVEENTGLTLTDILLIVLVVLIAIMVVILVLRLNRS